MTIAQQTDVAGPLEDVGVRFGTPVALDSVRTSIARV